MSSTYLKTMVTRDSLGIILSLKLLLVVAAQAQTGGPYDLTWSTIDGGGGTSSGEQYLLTGTIGQADAAYLYGGDYDVFGGFWPGGPLCIVNFKHYAIFASWWLVNHCDEGNDWCGGADLVPNGIVDVNDLQMFTDYWLYSCPANWPWK